MLIKEYRIPLPMSVEEYRIAQLYMIQKKSREESTGAGSGVEIVQNEPYEAGPGGKGQYTYKIYHIGSHLPGWFRAILPKSALRVEEEAWNAYPYTKTIYRCPFIEKFTLEIETVYLSDGGDQDNVFNLSGVDLRNRIVDLLDIVRDTVPGGDYLRDEDPSLFKSEKTGRGPLAESWRTDYVGAIAAGAQDKAIMCAYKLCKVEFKYWGMQSKIERFIHDVGLRKTMLRAHRQAWAWQDEYYGLTIEDIRHLEEETQRALHEKMAALIREEEGSTVSFDSQTHHTQNDTRSDGHQTAKVVVNDGHVQKAGSRTSMVAVGASRKTSIGSVRSRRSGTGPGLCNPNAATNKPKTESMIEGLEQLQTSSSDEEEFFDAQEDADEVLMAPGRMIKSSSMELLTPDEEYQDMDMAYNRDCSPLDRRVEHYRQLQSLGNSNSIDMSLPNTPTLLTQPSSTSSNSCQTTVLFLVLHGGSIMDTGTGEYSSKHTDISTLKATMENTVNAHYPAFLGHMAFRLVPCGHICAKTLQLLASLNPFSFDTHSPKALETSVVINESIPFGAISLFASGSPEYSDAVAKVISRTNSVHNEFLRSEEGQGFTGQVCIISDSIGSLMAYDALCKHNPYLVSRGNSRYGSHGSLHETDTAPPSAEAQSSSNPDLTDGEGSQKQTKPSQNADESGHLGIKREHSSRSQARYASCPGSRRTSTGSQSDVGKFDFEVTDLFMFGSPVALVLAYRKMCLSDDKNLGVYHNMQFLDPLSAAVQYHFSSNKDKVSDSLPRPACTQVFNLFYASDPTAVRLEPLLCDKFRSIAPSKVCRYHKFPLGDGQSIHVVEAIQGNSVLFVDHPLSFDHPSLERRQSNMSIASQVSGQGELTVSSITSITSRWWGNKRLDYALYCPDALTNFPSVALPYLLHASFWESSDVAAFILRQVVRQEYLVSEIGLEKESTFKPHAPREKWLKRRTTIKLKNVAPNHRANDVIVLEEKQQILISRFMYGPLDMVSLSGERVDVHIMVNCQSGEWVYFGTEVTDSNGRAVYNIPEEKKLPQGIYPVKMVVRGDHTSVDFFLTVLPPRTEAVVFSIDGSFTASVSIMGKDPKVRAGAVDVVRHWQELGYLIIYITARPDMQQKKVVAWLAQHNFPHGMVSFMDGLSADPLRQKANFLKHLIHEADIQIKTAYGSSKDITVYQGIGLKPDHTFIVGKASKKQHKEANILSEGYAAHLSGLQGISRPATGNARMFIRRSCFSLPGQHRPSSKRSVRKTVSLPQKGSLRENLLKDKENIRVNETGVTIVEPGLSPAGTAVRPRGSSPRVKISPFRYDSSNV